MSDHNDIFGQFGQVFGDLLGAGPETEGRGDDLQVELRVSFDEMLRGAYKSVEVTQRENCDSCAGTGDTHSSGAGRQCAACAGEGKQSHEDGFFLMQTVCPTCKGRGTTPREPCTRCDATGRVGRSRSFEVKVPAGVPDQAQLRMMGHGDWPYVDDADPGDLYVLVVLELGEGLQREGDDLIVAQPVSAERARRGGRIQVALPDGECAVIVPPGSVAGTELVIPDRGFRTLKATTRGAARIRLIVQKRGLLDRLFRRGSEPE